MSFGDSSDYSKRWGHFSNTALWLFLAKGRPVLPHSPGIQTLRAAPAPRVAFGNNKWESRERAGMVGSGFPMSAADTSEFIFAHFVGDLQCLGWQRGELTLSLDP